MANELFAAIEVENTVHDHFGLVSDLCAYNKEHTTFILLSVPINLKTRVDRRSSENSSFHIIQTNGARFLKPSVLNNVSGHKLWSFK
jgi:hypothetical protein